MDIDQVLNELRSQQLDPQTLNTSADRIWQELKKAAAAPAAEVEIIRGCADVQSLLPAFRRGQLANSRALLVRDHLRECVSCRRHEDGLSDAAESARTWQLAGSERRPFWSSLAFTWGTPQFAMAALFLIAVAIGFVAYPRYFGAPKGMRAQLVAADGPVFRVAMNSEQPLSVGQQVGEGELIRTAGGAHAFVRLLDGSLVEMNQRAEIAVNAGRRDTTIDLDQGNIIVQAAKRKTGHLYVVDRDCRVSVTGTVFSVNAGTKGSRVAVVEGEVRVAQAGANHVLHSGDEVTSNDSVGYVPVADEISWSQNLDKHLALLAEFASLKKQFEQIQTPGPRYTSNILPLLSANTVFYMSIPNLGQALAEANRIFQQELQRSDALREWWQEQQKNNSGPTLNEVVGKIQTASQYLGEEVVVTFGSDSAQHERGPVLLAPVVNQGLRQYLQTEFASLSGSGGPQMIVVDRAELASLTPGNTRNHLIALVRPDVLVIGGTLEAVDAMNAQLDAGAAAFAGTDFGRRITQAYGHGAGILIAADLHTLTHLPSKRRTSAPGQRHDAALAKSGFGDLKYLVLERRDISGVPSNRAELEFTGQRHGMASWLAAPAPMGSLDYVSPNAGAVVAFVAKNPALMFDDLLATISTADSNAPSELSRFEGETTVDIRNDLASTLGGDVAIALDGPVLPTPSWKVIAEVTDPTRLQATIVKLLNAHNQHAEAHGGPVATIDQQQASGLTFYTIRFQGQGLVEVNYTFADGYMIMAPSRALILSALRTHAGGVTLSRSADFQSALPKDEHTNFSAVFYQNLAPVIQPITSQLSQQQLQLLQSIAADSRPTVACAYGDSDRVEVVSNSAIPGFDLNALTLSSLLGRNVEHRQHQMRN